MHNGCGPDVIRTDTILRGIFGLKSGTACPKYLQNFPKIKILFDHLQDYYAYLSYALDWRDAIVDASELDVEECNINNQIHYYKCLATIWRYDLIIVSHVAAGDDMTVLNNTAQWFERRRGKLAVFLGNEYDLLDEKIGFINTTRAEAVCSQLPIDAARYLYDNCENTKLISMPHALNQNVYKENTDINRKIDIGFVGDIYWPFVGDIERTKLIHHFESNNSSYNINCDIRTTRMPRQDWAAYLRKCKGIIGAESGTYYLNERGDLLNRARDYNLNQNRDATFEEVYERFYKNVKKSVSGKSISSRHFEPIGTKTCQVLLEGSYNDILKPDIHYIPIKKDLSNVDEAMRKFKDDTYRHNIAETAYEYVMDEHTYMHRVKYLLRELDF